MISIFAGALVIAGLFTSCPGGSCTRWFSAVGELKTGSVFDGRIFGPGKAVSERLSRASLSPVSP